MDFIIVGYYLYIAASKRGGMRYCCLLVLVAFFLFLSSCDQVDTSDNNSSSFSPINYKPLTGYQSCVELASDLKSAFEKIATIQILQGNFWEGKNKKMSADSVKSVNRKINGFETNNQVTGVDEGDKIKSNGRFVFTFQINRIVVHDLQGNITDIKTFEDIDSIHRLLIERNRLLVFQWI